jgi:hypothetical protein
MNHKINLDIILDFHKVSFNPELQKKKTDEAQ